MIIFKKNLQKKWRIKEEEEKLDKKLKRKIK
jgi:hypothetical protein